MYSQPLTRNATLLPQRPRLYILLFLASFASVGTICISPALPQLAALLGTSEGGIQQVIMWYLAGYALGQLPFGPLGAYYGNKRVTVVSLAISAILAALCFLIIPFHSLGLFCALRFLLGLSMGVGLKMAFSFIAESFLEHQVAKMSSYLIVSFALAPSISVFITGWLVSWMGYFGALLFQLFYCILVFFLGKRLPPDQHDGTASLRLSYVLSTFKSCFTSPRIVIPAILMSLSTSIIYLFASEAPFIAINDLGLSPGMFGVLNFLTYFGSVSGGLLSAKVSHRLSKIVFIRMGIVIMSLGSLVMFFLYITNNASIYSTFIPMFFIFIGCSFYYANSAGYAIEQKFNKSYVSSTLAFIYMGIAVLFVLLLSRLHPTNILVMPSLFLVILAISIVLSFVLTKITKPKQP